MNGLVLFLQICVWIGTVISVISGLISIFLFIKGSAQPILKNKRVVYIVTVACILITGAILESLQFMANNTTQPGGIGTSNLTSKCQRNEPSYLTVTIKNIVKTSASQISIDFVFNNASDTALHLNFSNITIIDTDSGSTVAFRDHDLPAVDIDAHGFTGLPLSFSGFDNSHLHHYAFTSQIRNDIQWACDFIPIRFTLPGN